MHVQIALQCSSMDNVPGLFCGLSYEDGPLSLVNRNSRQGMSRDMMMHTGTVFVCAGQWGDGEIAEGMRMVQSEDDQVPLVLELPCSHPNPCASYKIRLQLLAWHYTHTLSTCFHYSTGVPAFATPNWGTFPLSTLWSSSLHHLGLQPCRLLMQHSVDGQHQKHTQTAHTQTSHCCSTWRWQVWE